jgi:hypothetical protein
MDELVTTLNGLTTYPGIADLHNYATQLQTYSQADQATVFAAMTNPLLVDDIKRILNGTLPSTMTAPIFVQPIAPTAPNYPTPTSTIDPAFAKGEPPTIKPVTP